MVDLYCERLGPGLWAEPVNAITNAAFLLAAWAAWRISQQHRLTSPSVWLLLGLMVAIGVGSGLFHTFATTWARVLDVVPILLFSLIYIWVYSRRIVRLPAPRVAIFVTIYLVAALSARQFPDVLTQSLTYAPAAVVLLGAGSYHYLTQRAEPLQLLYATGVFITALTFRTVDTPICPYVALGTHFLWHLFSAAMLCLLMNGLLVNLDTERSSLGEA